MKNLLYITYVFPPTGGAGIQRNVKFIKYLSRMGWKITVVTPENPSVPTRDDSFAGEISPDVNVIYTRTLEPGYSIKQGMRSGIEDRRNSGGIDLRRWITQVMKLMAQSIFLPDVQILWSLPSFPVALKVIKRNKIDVIFASAPPFSSLVFASWLSRISGVPCVADFRDEWVDFIDKHYDSHKKIFGRRVVRAMEASVVKQASAVTMASPSYVNNLCRKYPFATGKVFDITNGFDPEDFPSHLFNCGTVQNDRLTIAYFGSVIKANTARYFLEACRRLTASKPEYRDQFEVHFAGRIADDENVLVDRYIKDIHIRRHGYLDHTEAVRRMNLSDVLLVLVDDLPGAERMISGKIFEYLYMQKAVLAVVPQGGEVDRIIRSVGCGLTCPPRDYGRIGEAIETLIQQWQQGTLNKKKVSDDSIIRAFSREALTERLSQILTRILNNH